MSLGRTRSFKIFDPKPRVIHAPCFRERVLHHALFEHVGPVLDRALVDDTFACREGKGSLAAVLRAQQHARRFPWFVKTDIRAYFASVDHDLLHAALARKLRDRGVLELCERIIRAHAVTPGRGLPLGALSSQHFANFFLAPLDRLLLESLRVAGMVRYMDDVVAWCRSRAEARVVREAIIEFTRDHLRLEVRQPTQIQRSACGLSFLGFRIYAGSLRLSRRRRRRHARARQRWERAYSEGRIDASTLQAGYAAALAITAHADARSWRQEQLRRAPEVDA